MTTTALLLALAGALAPQSDSQAEREARFQALLTGCLLTGDFAPMSPTRKTR